MSEQLCDYGCGRKAIHQFKSGKWCCELHWSKCIAYKKNKIIYQSQPQPLNINSKMLCSYGCNTIAKYQFENGKVCCKKTYMGCPVSIEKRTGENNGMYGKTHTDEVKQRFKIIRRRENLSPETLRKMSESHKKENLSLKTRKKISESSRRENLSPETLRKMSESHKKENLSLETLRKMSEAGKKENRSPETLRKMSESHKGNPTWNKGKTDIFSEEALKKISAAGKRAKGRKFSKEHRINLGISARERIKKQIEKRLANGAQVTPAFNPRGCDMIDILNENGYNFQHAQNGGEFYIIGFWLDGYDAEKNIAIEIDEPAHFIDGQLKEKDIERQSEIERELNCKFIRIKVDKNNNILDVDDKKFEELLK